MAVLTYTQLKQLWTANGGNPAWAPMAAAVALAESGGNTQSVNSTDPAGGSYGLWQINGVHASAGVANPTWAATMFDPNANAKEAVALSGNGANWAPWEGDPVAAAFLGTKTPPSDAQVQTILTASGRSTGGGTSSAGGAVASPAGQTGTVTDGGAELGLLNPTRCVVQGPFGWCVANAGQARTIKGYSIMILGGTGMVVGLALLAAVGFKRTGAARALSSVPGPIGRAGTIAAGRRSVGPRGGSSSSSSSGAKVGATARAGKSSKPKANPITFDGKTGMSSKDATELRQRRDNDSASRRTAASDRQEREDGFGGR